MFIECSWKELCGNVWKDEVYIKRDCLLCLAGSIQHFTAHKISALVCSDTVLNVAVSYREGMKYTTRKSWRFSVIVTSHKYLCL